jgi:hypothetical protein
VIRKNFDKRKKIIELLKKGELVMLNGRNIRGKHHCKKLEDEVLGPFQILSVGRNLRYVKLKLPNS